MKVSDFKCERNIDGVTIHLPEPPNANEIFGYNLPTSKQKFTRVEPPENWKSLSESELQQYLSKELDLREKGFWFWNNGNIEYITGLHYFILNVYKTENGKIPRFIDAQRDVLYFWEACVKSPVCYGMTLVTDRRFGKTLLGNGMLYEYATRVPYAHCGIQSKTAEDGKGVFRKLIQSWKSIHPIWRPSDSGVLSPRTELLFEVPSTRSTKGEVKEYEFYLNSKIDFKPATEVAYDGAELGRIYNDETGKTLDANVVRRHQVQKYCLVDRHGDRGIKGKSFNTTTVEEMTKGGGANMKILWDQSDLSKVNKYGQTESGLWRMFKPADYGSDGEITKHIDEYGYTNRESARAEIMEKRKALTGTALYAMMQKEPLTVDEAFKIIDKNDVFPSFKIYEQQDFNFTLNAGSVRQGNFTENEEGKIVFWDDPNGWWKVSWIPKPEEQNKVIIIEGRACPGNERGGCIGVDPYDHATTSGDRKSDAGIYGFRNFSVAESYMSNSFVCEFLHRPEIPEMMYEEVLKAARFYGWKFLAENQKPGVMNYAKAKGFGGYVMKTQASDYTTGKNKKWVDGIPTTSDIARQDLINGLTTYIYTYIGKLDAQTQIEHLGISEPDETIHGFCPFSRLLDDWLKFDANKWTDHDATVASMIAYHGARRYFVKKRLMEPEGDKKPLLVFPKTRL